ncbi:MAG: OmpH family outer membrane protein [Treponema sp.]|nr:OmpH family outer membrane protein [Treponema sp.]
MKKTNKILLVVCALFALFVSNGFAQQKNNQITKFAVVDTSKIYSSFYKNSEKIRNYEKKKQQFQAEIAKRTEELRDLKSQKVAQEKAGNSAEAMRIQAEITKKTEYLTEYTNTKNIELEALLTQMQRDDDFYKKLYKTLGKVAAEGGYSMVLSLQESNAILWFSPSVDITNDVIKELGLKK